MSRIVTAQPVNETPNWSVSGKYLVYFQYLLGYIINFDLKSLVASLNYILFHKLPKESFQTTSQMGTFHIRKGTNDFQFINMAYEKSVKKYIKDHINSFDIFIDVGACIGEYSIWLARYGKQCIAFEPVNFTAAMYNIRLNRCLDSIRLYEVGLSDKRQEVYFEKRIGNTGASHIVFDGNNIPNTTLVQFDAIYNHLKIHPAARILIKLDVEGMEPEVLMGMEQFLAKTSNIQIIYEYFEKDGLRNDEAIKQFGNFDIIKLDGFNRVAIKK